MVIQWRPFNITAVKISIRNVLKANVTEFWGQLLLNTSHGTGVTLQSGHNLWETFLECTFESYLFSRGQVSMTCVSPGWPVCWCGSPLHSFLNCVCSASGSRWPPFPPHPTPGSGLFNRLCVTQEFGMAGAPPPRPSWATSCYCSAPTRLSTRRSSQGVASAFAKKKEKKNPDRKNKQ